MKPPNPVTPPGQAAPPPPAAELDLAAIRARLNGVRGQDYWRSLEEIAETHQFQQLLEREFPAGAGEWEDGVSRRTFLKLAAASFALAGLTACTKQPTELIYPYVRQPAELVLGQPLYYATAMVLGGFATGVLAKNREGHPIKVDGNPEHPAALGGSSVWLQASILGLYDPDRSQTVTCNGEISDWARFQAELIQLAAEQRRREGAGLRFLTEPVTSPTLAGQMAKLLERFPQARFHEYDPVSRDNVHEGALLAFGQVVAPQYRFEKAATIVALDADFLYTHPERLRYTRAFTNGRRVSTGQRTMSRLYVVESTPTVTGTMADHRLPVRSGKIETLARWLAARVGVPVEAPAEHLPAAEAAWIETVAGELNGRRGSSLLLAGEWQPPIVHALAHLMNDHLGNNGSTLYYTEPGLPQPRNQLRSLSELAAEMREGAVDTLFILGSNPAYSAPVDLEFAQLLPRIQRSIHVGEYLDETAALCTWHIPQAHYLESWGDTSSYDGTVTLQQPLIAPLYNGKTILEVLGALLQPELAQSDYQIVREFWRQQRWWPDFERGWRQALHDGLIKGRQAPEKKVKARTPFEAGLSATGRRGTNPAGDLPAEARPDSAPAEKTPAFEITVVPPPAASRSASPLARRQKGQVQVHHLEICFRPDPNLWDGRFANNGWLQECPKPVTKLVWDNAVLISPLLGERSGLRSGDVVEVSFQGRTVEGPVLITPGQAVDSVTVHLGYGRRRTGRVGTGIGFDAGRVRPRSAFWVGNGASLRSTGAHQTLVTTQTHHNLHSPERQIYRAARLGDFLARPEIIKESVVEPPVDQTLYNPELYEYTGYKWGMSIDLTTCIGCNACVLACNFENNIPVVGKEQVKLNREMLWIRIDTYFRGDPDNPEYSHMPVPCMHCEHAPCELVCPTEAAVHDHEGLNLQVYNRCVGTRFCSNNCPYKVRRFNFLRYSPYDVPHLKPMYNPEVTVRWRGVMEKCTYCIQRIASARITAEKENRSIREGEVRTACQQACPAEAIVFGDLNNPESKVARLKQQPLDYPVLGQLNTRPRTTYLAKIENRNPDLADQPPISRHPKA